MDILDLINNYICNDKETLRNVIVTFLDAVMEEDAKKQCGSEYYERSESLSDYQNGVRKNTISQILR